MAANETNAQRRARRKRNTLGRVDLMSGAPFATHELRNYQRAITGEHFHGRPRVLVREGFPDREFRRSGKQ